MSQKNMEGQIHNMTNIADRPTIVDNGDWKVNTIISKHHKKALVSLAERK